MDDHPKSDVAERIPGIKTRAELVDFIRALADDSELCFNQWQNQSLYAYLESMAAWLAASAEIPAGFKDEELSWSSVANILLAPKYYE
jgi:hypothetical protein